MKNCKQCKTLKSLSDFYKHPLTLDGFMGKCKECIKEGRRSEREREKQEEENRKKAEEERLKKEEAERQARLEKEQKYRDFLAKNEGKFDKILKEDGKIVLIKIVDEFIYE